MGATTREVVQLAGIWAAGSGLAGCTLWALGHQIEKRRVENMARRTEVVAIGPSGRCGWLKAARYNSLLS